jgi:hypothetical protein
VSQYPPSQPPPGPGWGPNPSPQPGWSPAPPGPPPPEQGWTPPPGAPGAPGAPGWQTQPGGYGTPPPGVPGGQQVDKPSRGPAVYIALAVVVVAAAAGAYFVLAGGGSDSASPEGVVRSYYDAAVDGDCDTMMGHVDLAASGVSREVALGLCEELYAEDGLEQSDIPTELNSIETTSESGDKAVVSVSYETADGPDSEEVNLNKVDGDWKVDLGEFGGTDDTTATTEGPDDTTTTTEESTTTTEESTTTTDDTAGGTETPEGSLQAPPLDTQEAIDNPALATLATECGEGQMSSCDQLFWDSELDGELEAYAKTCGGLEPEGDASDQCVSLFGEQAG